MVLDLGRLSRRRVRRHSRRRHYFHEPDWYALHSGWSGVSLMTFGVVVAAVQIVRRDAGFWQRTERGKENWFSQLDPTVNIKKDVPNLMPRS